MVHEVISTHFEGEEVETIKGESHGNGQEISGCISLHKEPRKRNDLASRFAIFYGNFITICSLSLVKYNRKYILLLIFEGKSFHF